MHLPRLLLALIDPASAAMDRSNGRKRRPVYRGGAVFGPGVSGGSRQATQEEIAAFRQQVEQRSHSEGALPGLHPDQPAAEIAARELISTGSTTLQGTQGTLRAQVIKFWHGDSILHINRQDRIAESTTRIPRRLGPEHEELIEAYLIAQLRRN